MERALKLPVQAGLCEPPGCRDPPLPVDDASAEVGHVREGVVGPGAGGAEEGVEGGNGGAVGGGGGGDLPVLGGPLVQSVGGDGPVTEGACTESGTTKGQQLFQLRGIK